jgi:hypothetical protein
LVEEVVVATKKTPRPTAPAANPVGTYRERYVLDRAVRSGKVKAEFEAEK